MFDCSDGDQNGTVFNFDRFVLSSRFMKFTIIKLSCSVNDLVWHNKGKKGNNPEGKIFSFLFC